MSSIRIGFTENRHGLRVDQINSIISILDKYDNIIVSHGDCVGSDTDFHKLCISYKLNHVEKILKINIYPPNNSSLRAFNKGDIIMEEKPYLERNINIIKNADILIACPVDKNNEELRSGTWSTIRQAKKYKIITYIF